MLKKKKEEGGGNTEKGFLCRRMSASNYRWNDRIRKSPFCWNPRVIIDLDQNGHWMPKTLHKIC